MTNFWLEKTIERRCMYIHTYTHMHIHMCTHMNTHMHTLTLAHSHTHAHMNTYMRAHTRAHTILSHCLTEKPGSGSYSDSHCGFACLLCCHFTYSVTSSSAVWMWAWKIWFGSGGVLVWESDWGLSRGRDMFDGMSSWSRTEAATIPEAMRASFWPPFCCDLRNFLSLLLNHPFQNHGSCLDSKLSHRVAYELGKSWQVYHLWAQCLPAPLVPATYLFSVGQPCWELSTPTEIFHICTCQYGSTTYGWLLSPWSMVRLRGWNWSFSWI